MGSYYITFYTRDRTCIINDVDLIEEIEKAWSWLPSRISGVIFDAIAIMPNHVHLIVKVVSGSTSPHISASNLDPVRTIVGMLKSIAAEKISQRKNLSQDEIWQDGYYEYVIQTEEELETIAQYIRVNRSKWQYDSANPNRVPNDIYDRKWEWLEKGHAMMKKVNDEAF